MKLSEAIREGAKLRPQGFGAYFRFDNNCSCAMGAAFEATLPKRERRKRGASYLAKYIVAVEAEAKFPVLQEWFEYPISGDHRDSLGSIIIGLNDDAHWTREQIADFVESLGF